MRAKQSFTASQMVSDTLTPPTRAAVLDIPPGAGDLFLCQPAKPQPLTSPPIADDEGLLHDARNLIGALGLYCDLLSMPGVLKPEHRHYAEEVRLLGERSAAMIQHLMEQRLRPTDTWPSPKTDILQPPESSPAWPGLELRPSAHSVHSIHPVSLRSVVERCSGLLSRVSAGKPVEITYGPAAAAPIAIEEEAVERILVNLVRNAAAALSRSALLDSCASKSDATGSQPAIPILIGVGMLVNRVGDPKPWPFRRVRLTVEDSGCGMSAEQLERLLSSGRAPSRGCHGIGFRVVRELVAASSGDIRVMSTAGVGTRVQIEWPMIVPSPVTQPTEPVAEVCNSVERRLSC